MLIIQEHKSSSYSPRTYANAASADVTVAIAVDHNTAGEKCTQKAAGDKIFKIDFSYDWIDSCRELFLHMRKHNLKTVNIAGNGIYTFQKHGIPQKDVNYIVHKILDTIHYHWGIDKIVSGGQTGADLAGAVAAYKLGIPCVVTMPKGFKMRFVNGKDYDHSEEFVRKLIVDYAEKLS